MWKKIAIAGSAAAVILGAGTAALAASGSSSTSSTSPGRSHAAKAAGKAGALAARGPLKHALHGSWVTRAGKGESGYVTHDAIRGQVTEVSAGSITVKAADGVSQTYTVTGSTKVHHRGDAKGSTATISEVKAGDRVLVVGTGTSSLTATQVLDVTKK